MLVADPGMGIWAGVAIGEKRRDASLLITSTQQQASLKISRAETIVNEVVQYSNSTLTFHVNSSVLVANGAQSMTEGKAAADPL